MNLRHHPCCGVGKNGISRPPPPTPTFYSLFYLMEIIMDIIFFIFSDFLDVKYTKTLNMNTMYISIMNKFDNIKKYCSS